MTDLINSSVASNFTLNFVYRIGSCSHQQLVDRISSLRRIFGVGRHTGFNFSPELVYKMELAVEGSAMKGEGQDSRPGTSGVDDDGVFPHTDAKHFES